MLPDPLSDALASPDDILLTLLGPEVDTICSALRRRASDLTISTEQRQAARMLSARLRLLQDLNRKDDDR